MKRIEEKHHRIVLPEPDAVALVMAAATPRSPTWCVWLSPPGHGGGAMWRAGLPSRPSHRLALIGECRNGVKRLVPLISMRSMAMPWCRALEGLPCQFAAIVGRTAKAAAEAGLLALSRARGICTASLGSKTAARSMICNGGWPWQHPRQGRVLQVSHGRGRKAGQRTVRYPKKYPSKKTAFGNRAKELIN